MSKSKEYRCSCCDQMKNPEKGGESGHWHKWSKENDAEVLVCADCCCDAVTFKFVYIEDFIKWNDLGRPYPYKKTN